MLTNKGRIGHGLSFAETSERQALQTVRLQRVTAVVVDSGNLSLTHTVCRVHKNHDKEGGGEEGELLNKFGMHKYPLLSLQPFFFFFNFWLLF